MWSPDGQYKYSALSALCCQSYKLPKAIILQTSPKHTQANIHRESQMESSDIPNKFYSQTKWQVFNSLFFFSLNGHLI